MSEKRKLPDHIQRAFDEGGSVLIGGRTVTRAEDLTEADLAEPEPLPRLRAQVTAEPAASPAAEPAKPEGRGGR
jgi:hypothetical protein